MGWEVGEGFKTEGTYVYLYGRNQHCKAIIFQLKINSKKRQKKKKKQGHEE